MAQTFALYANQTQNPATAFQKVSPVAFSGRVRILSDVVTYASQPAADTIIVGGAKLPIGAQVLYVALTTSVTTGTATIALGSTASASKYKAAGAVTTADVPQFFGVAAGVLVDTTAEESLMLTIGTAALPASGTLKVEVFYVTD